MNKIDIVLKMQNYIKHHIQDDDFCIHNLYNHIGYSKRHADRMFSELLNMTPSEYIKAIKLTESVSKLANSNNSVLNIALDSGFESHEGFTRTFKNKFSIAPNKYRNTRLPIPLFVQYPVNHYQILKNRKENKMNTTPMICTVTAIKKPERKFIFKRSVSATGYLSYCEENGCEWEGFLNSIDKKLDTAALTELPKHLIKQGYSHIAAGIEVPADYNYEIPEYETVLLPEALYLYFQSEPYNNEDDFYIAIECVDKAIEKYDYSRFGYSVIKEKAPTYNYGAQTKTGARIAIPVEKIK
ncbi:MAG: helix-turn-helix transcriptional regulator [Eubacterium sp.]|nr:helix-turn-helix transcriptional regulator [Eubacterium sp.]